MLRTSWRLVLAMLGLVAIAAAALSLDDLDVFAPTLPTHIATNDRIDGLELRVYVPAADTAALDTSVRVTPTSNAIAFSPASFVFNAVHAVAHFSLEALASGSYTIEYIAVETQTNASAVSVQQTISVLPPPTSFELTDLAWHGVVLQNDSFEQPPTAAGVYRASGFWSHLAHAYPSNACGAFDGDRALYFTALGDRFAVTTPLNLLGFHGKMHFRHVYGSRSIQTYDRTGDNRIACECVDPSEETVFSYLPSGRDALNRSAWETLYEVPLSNGTSAGAFSTHSVLLPTLSMHTAAQFRWQQKNHSSFPIDVASGLTLDAIVAAANDNTSVNGELGRSEQEVWRYRNLFDQWALDTVQLEVRLNVPLFTIATSDSAHGSTDVIVQSPIERSWVEVLVGDGTHAFPSCSATATTTPRAQSSTVHLTVNSYVHAVACLQVNTSLISSFPTRSARVLVQARAPRLTSVLDTTASIDTWRVTLACDGCTFMRYTLRARSPPSSDEEEASEANARESPNCLYGTLVNGIAQVVSVTSNARLEVVACGPDLVMSDVVSSEPYTVRPRTPTFVFTHPETTITGLINVTIVPSDATSVGIAYAIGDNAVLPDCSEIRSASNNSAVVAGNQTVQVQVSDVVRAVACCMDRVCDDSEFAVWGPLSVRAVAPVFTMACSRVKPLTMVITIESVTAGASVQYHVGNVLPTSPLTCATGVTYTEPVQVASVSTTVFAISCRDGLQMSSQIAIPVTLDHCCAGIDAYLYPSCAHVLLLADNFATCVDATKWSALTSQWGGADVNGGVHASNVKCVHDASLNKTVLALHAHGDLYSGTLPVGHARSSTDGTLRGRTVDDAFIEWALDGVSTVPCNQLERCAARRVGAAVSTKLKLNAGVMVLRLKPCDAFGTLTQIWWGAYEANDALAQQLVPFLPLWKAALTQAKTASDMPFVLSSPRTNDAFIEIAMQWNASDGRANVYVNGALVLQQRSSSDSSSSSAASLANSTLSLGVWFPNAVAGEPLFPSCQVLVDHVQVFKMEVTGDRWCDIVGRDDSEQQHSVACEDDVDCERWVTLNCFMHVYEATCIAHHDELSDFRNSDTADDAEGEDVAVVMETSKFCHFRLEPTAHSRVSVTEMTSRTQQLHWSAEEQAIESK